MMTTGCACRRPPPTVDMTHSFIAIDTDSLSAATTTDDKVDVAVHSQDDLLRNNLQTHGWSPLVIDLSVLQEREESRQSPLARIHPTVLKRQVESLFAKDVIQENPPLYAIYRGRNRESGNSKTIEPKQSWEVSRCSLHSDSDLRLQLLERWTQALHDVAMAVSRRLNWPRNLLVQDEHCDLKHSPTSPCNVDLLRVFLYDRIIPPPNTNPRNAPLVLGSSPHSDWGSLTVVWQDDVGGLQHFCVKCRAWVDITPPPITSQKLHLIVHLGDVASLAIGHAAAAASDDKCNNIGNVNHTNSMGGSGKPQSTRVGSASALQPLWSWPSPRHRVLCSTIRNRASLVYFCYPPPELSIQDLQDGLQNFVATKSSTAAGDTPTPNNPLPSIIPYPCYSLLHNQSLSSTASSKSVSGTKSLYNSNNNHHHNNNSLISSNPQDVYQSIRIRPLHEVFAEKWQQVQRGI